MTSPWREDSASPLIPLQRGNTVTGCITQYIIQLMANLEATQITNRHGLKSGGETLKMGMKRRPRTWNSGGTDVALLKARGRATGIVRKVPHSQHECRAMNAE